MTRWLRAKHDRPCGACRGTIATGDRFLKLTSGLERCEPCGVRLFGEPPPEQADDEGEGTTEVPTGVPPGVRHQASFGFQSLGAFARPALSNHLRQRRNRGVRR
jgi:hypothetical protein